MFKRIFWTVIIVSFFVVLIFGYFQKDNLNRFISEKMQEQTTAREFISGEVLIDSLYNYVQNGLNYKFTLLEFGSTGCTICKQMEPILEEVRTSKSAKINVVFLNTMYPENQSLVKYFGISAIPMQVLLDNQGNTFFKHYGFISTQEILSKTSER